MTRRRSFSVVMVSAAFLCSGCFGSVPDTHYYTLRTPSEVAARPNSKATLLVDQLEVDAAYEDERIAYRTSPFQLQYYNYHLWSASPSVHISDYLRNAYEASGFFSQVSRAPTPDAAVVLTGRVTAFEEVDKTKNDWLGRVALKLWLRNARTGALLWSEEFREEEPLRKRNPEGLAAALSIAMARIVRQSAPLIAEVATSRAEEASTASGVDWRRQ
jgi:ABC-type uncharacterized transport system auxiliary subunit